MPTYDLTTSIVVQLIIGLGFFILSWIFFYVIVKAAVRNGTMEAHRQMEIDDGYEAPHGR